MELAAPIPRGLSLSSASLILLLCVVAQLSHVDHLVATSIDNSVAAPADDGHAHGAHDHDIATGSEQHKMHCHDGLASCSEMPLPAGPGQPLFAIDLLLPPALADLLLAKVGDSSAPAGVTTYLPLQPPQSDVAAI